MTTCARKRVRPRGSKPNYEGFRSWPCARSPHQSIFGLSVDRTLGAPSLSRFVIQGWETATPTTPHLNSPQKWAPHPFRALSGSPWTGLRPWGDSSRKGWETTDAQLGCKQSSRKRLAGDYYAVHCGAAQSSWPGDLLTSTPGGCKPGVPVSINHLNAAPVPPSGETWLVRSHA